jgi:hypothetical protein
MVTVKRNVDAVDWYTKDYDRLGIPYKLKQGTYTTTLESELGKFKFFSNDFPKRVFMASNMIKKDVKESLQAAEIMNTKHIKMNYGSKKDVDNIITKDVLNIDLTGAYVQALWHTGIIQEKTYQYLLKLPKMERLPAIGMLATSYVELFYEKGKCVSFKPHRAETSEIFFHLIDEINFVMRDIEYMLGDDYIFHWVDGVFFKKETDNKKIQNVENFLLELDYPYKYESVETFKVRKQEDVVRIEMYKNNKFKRYEFSTGESGRNLTQLLLQNAQANYIGSL